jgi:PilZ domain
LGMPIKRVEVIMQAQTTEERRALGSNRIPFDALVEVGGDSGEGFEAQAIDISQSGMHLRTAYLPDIGQTLTCRFEMPAGSIVSEGQVVWKQDADQGGEFGIQFTNVDPESEVALLQAFKQAGGLEAGTKVRLHIDGLGAPMRARVRMAEKAKISATSELAFLKIGNALELEDAATGNKRPAKIRGVEVEMDAESNIPKLVVSMRYSDADDSISEPVSVPAQRTTMKTSRAPLDEARALSESESDEAEDLKSPLARAFSKVTPALLSASSRARESVRGYMEKRALAKDEVQTGDAAPRRTTSPPPNGGLHASGRKVTREAVQVQPSPSAQAMSTLSNNKRKIGIGLATLCAVSLGYAGLHKSDPKPTAELAPESAMTAAAALPAPAPIVAAPAAPVAMTMPPDAIGPSSPGSDSETSSSAEETPKGKAIPFGHGNVTGGRVLHIKMDGRIDRIQGASEPTGFTVVIPKRKSVTSSSSLLKQDKRIEKLTVANEGSGAEIRLSFKDGVPAYLVRAKNDTLEVVLGKPSEGDEMTRPELKRASAGGHKKHDVKHGKKKHHAD